MTEGSIPPGALKNWVLGTIIGFGAILLPVFMIVSAELLIVDTIQEVEVKVKSF